MNDNISRQAAIDALETIGYDFSDSGLSEIELEEVCEAVGDVRQDMINIIKRLPSAQTERKPGKWSIKNGEFAFWDVCSECGRMVMHKAPFYKFCPHCGAEMRGADDEG